MGQEIERKFLIDKGKWEQVVKPPGEFYQQGYISTDPNKTIRIRLTETGAALTIKGLTTGAKRLEYEYAIPKTDAKELLDNFSVSGLTKIRYKINFHDKIWEVDEFQDSNAGLIVAEIELESEHEHFDLPEWVTQEVTGEEKYYNSNLTINPYKNWNL